MGKTVLQQIYDNEAGPGEAFLCNDPVCRKLNREIGGDYEYFKSRFSPEDWSRFQEMENRINARSCQHNYANFAYGFRLGVGLMLEVIADDGGLGRNDE